LFEEVAQSRSNLFLMFFNLFPCHTISSYHTDDLRGISFTKIYERNHEIQRKMQFGNSSQCCGDEAILQSQFDCLQLTSYCFFGRMMDLVKSDVYESVCLDVESLNCTQPNEHERIYRKKPRNEENCLKTCAASRVKAETIYINWMKDVFACIRNESSHLLWQSVFYEQKDVFNNTFASHLVWFVWQGSRVERNSLENTNTRTLV
jgi:hypothetical protein